jgi:hypothetical protein
MTRRIAHAAWLVALVLALALVPAALAGKGGNQGSSGGSSLSLVLLSSSDGLPHWNQWVTFNVSTTATDKPFVQLNCYQNGAWVYTASAGFFPTYPWAPNFDLASSAWTGGAADCTARLYSTSHGGTRTTTLATMSFHVYA